MRTACITLALALLAAGCGDSNSPNVINGSYTLESVGGNPVPTVFYTETDYSLEATQGSISINNNGTFTDSYTIRENSAGSISTATFACAGTWSQSRGTLTLQENDTSTCGDLGTATWDGSNRLTVNWDSFGVPAVHVR